MECRVVVVRSGGGIGLAMLSLMLFQISRVRRDLVNGLP